MADNELIPPTPSQETYAVEDDQGDVFTINDPFALFADWLALAKQTEPNDPNAMSLATVDANGQPNVRVVLLKHMDATGLTFFTNSESAKGEEIAQNAHAALCFHWKSIRRQVRFRGPAELVSNADSDAYFAGRARGAQIGAWASAQSRPLDDRKTLEKAIDAFEKKFDGGEVPRPDFWRGYRVTPIEIEFWVNRPYRLHERLTFTREDETSPWRSQNLYP
ncbi:MAG: pyridoxamine 5'-phosphate oxidase [Pseudomonadota bacterium]